MLDKLFGGIAGPLVDVEITITDLRDAVYPTEFDCLISAEPQHRVGDLSAALLSLRADGYGGPGAPGALGAPGGWQAGPPGLWLNGAQLDPAAPLASSGIRAGARLGFGGPLPVGRGALGAPGAPGAPGGPSWDAGPGDTISLRADPANPFGWLVNKPFRTVPALPAPIVVDAAGGVESPRRRSSWLTLLIAPVLSLAIGAVVGWRLHQWLFLLLGLGGVAGSLVPQLINRRTDAGHARRAKRESRDAVAAGQARLGDAVTAEEQARRQALPEPAGVRLIAAGPGTRLWERSPQDQDFLRLRAGTGDLLASTVNLRGGSSGGPYDPAGDSAPVVRDVPVAVPLADLGVLGIAGPPREPPALAWAVSQLAILHGPSDLRLVLLTEEPAAWRWARWLPHLRPLGGATDWLSVGTEPATWTRRITELRDLMARRHAAADGPRRGVPPGHGGYDGRERPLPVVVLVIDGSASIRDVPGIHEVLSHGPAAGVFVICRDDDWRDLPGVCRGRLDTDPAGGGTGVYRERETGRAIDVARLDLIGEQWADETARALAPIRDRLDERETGTSGTVRLLDLWGVRRPDPAAVAAAVAARRADHQGSARADRGRGAVHPRHRRRRAAHAGRGHDRRGQERIPADAGVLARAGQRAGGAGVRADRLQGRGRVRRAPPGCRTSPASSPTSTSTWAAGRWWRCARSPGTASGCSLSAGCPDIGSYHAAGEPRGPLPRLVLVVDEFAVLAERMPDFLNELTDVTRQGRSMGIHLVLATQRPAGVVSEDIRSNMALRVCLRVEDPQDSTAVIEIARRRRDRPRSARPRLRAHPARRRRPVPGRLRRRPGARLGSRPARRDVAARGAAAVRGGRRAAGTARRPARGCFARRPGRGNRPVRAGGGHGRRTGRHAPPHRAWLDPLPELTLAGAACPGRTPAPPAAAPGRVRGGGQARRNRRSGTSPSTWKPAPTC